MALSSSSTLTQPAGSSSIVSVSHPQFTRNASCPTQRTLSSTMNPLLEKKYSSSSHTLHTYFNQNNQRSNTIPAQHSTISENKNFLQKIKSRVVNLFKHIASGNSINNNKDHLVNINQQQQQQQQQQQSTFIYDPELDLREEHLSLVAKRLLTTLRESKIKHLSCDNLFLPCNHIRNIARQCLIMSAEEPFGIMGAQIKIKLTLLSPDMTSTITKYLPIIQINPKQKTTFEIEIDLHEDTKVFTLKNFLPSMKMFKQIRERSPLYTTSSVVYKKTNPSMSMTNNSLTSTTTSTPFGRNSSYPTSIHSKEQSAGFNGRRCFSSAILPSSDEFQLKSKSINCQTLERDMQLNDTVNISWFERCKQRFTNIFKQISKPTSKEDSITMINTHPQSSSTFTYDPELDLSEEYLSLVAKRILSTLRESKIKHLSCDNLFLPCNHIRNIARQCLIMSAEEPFGIMGAQIKIKLTLLSPDMISTTTKYLPIIQINPKQKTTFEIEIDLHEDTKVFTLRRILPSIKMFKKLIERSPLYVSPRCTLVKNVFYKTAEPKRAFVNSMV